SGLARMLPSMRRLADGGAAYLHYYGDRVLAAPYRELRAVAAFREAQGPDTIDLASGEPRFDLVPSATTKLPADRRGLPPVWGLPELREAVGEHLVAGGSLAADGSDEVLVTLGAAGS